MGALSAINTDIIVSNVGAGMQAFLTAARPLIVDSLGVIVFAALTAMHVDFRVAVCFGVVTAMGVVASNIVRHRPIAPLQWISLALVLISATATFLTNDPRFVMAKPSVVYAIVGAFLLRRGWMNRYVPAQFLPLVEDRMTAFGYVWAGLMFLTAAANLIVALAFTASWPAFIAVFPLSTKIALFAVQYVSIRVTIRARSATLRAASTTP
jgi:intracellular septation protein